MFYTIIYKSKAKEGFASSRIHEMLLKAKINNKKYGVSGCIVFSDNQFVQIIEGDKSKITQLYRNIKLDNRHTNVMTLVETATSHTLWDDWSMAFYNFTGNPNEDQHNRVLLESYFESASDDLKSTETFLVLRKAIQSILN